LNHFWKMTLRSSRLLLTAAMTLLAVPVLSGWRWVVLISPVFVVVLLTRISGIPMLERRAEKRWGDEPEFRRYTDSTSVLIPLPPKR